MKTKTASIIILACNKRPYTERTLERLLQSSYPSVELILVDNGSTDGTRDLFADCARQAEARGWQAKTLLLDENVGAVQGRNRALRMVTGEYVVFMDNDIVVGTRSWLERMTETLERNPTVGVLGPKILFAEQPHNIQCAGCIVGKGGRVTFRGRGEPHDAAAYNSEFESPCLISACWIMPRAVVDAVGDLDMRFHPVQFEDIDYCYRIRESGWRILYDPSVWVYHFENVTTDGTPDLNYKYLTIKNGLAFKRKWAHIISKENGPDDASMEWKEIPHAAFADVGELPFDD